MKITFKEDTRCFTKGTTFDFGIEPLVLIVGSNGSGKSTLMDSIRQHKKETNWVEEYYDLKDAIEFDEKPEDIRAFSSLIDDSQGAVKCDMDLYLKYNGLSNCNLSNGQNTLANLSQFLEGLSECDVILLDEIDKGFDMAAQLNAWRVILHCTRFAKTTLCITHNVNTLTSLRGFPVYDMDEQEFTTPDEYLAKLERKSSFGGLGS